MSCFSLWDASVHGLHLKYQPVAQLVGQAANPRLAGCIPTPHVNLSLGKTVNPKLFPMEPGRSLHGSGHPLVCGCVGWMGEWKFIVKHCGVQRRGWWIVYNCSPVYHLPTLLTNDNIDFYCSSETGIVSLKPIMTVMLRISNDSHFHYSGHF